jgi:hypothetical protein
MLNHKQLLKTSLDVSKWLTIHINNRGTQYRIAPFSCNLQWFKDKKISAKIAEVKQNLPEDGKRKCLVSIFT